MQYFRLLVPFALLALPPAVRADSVRDFAIYGKKGVAVGPQCAVLGRVGSAGPVTVEPRSTVGEVRSGDAVRVEGAQVKSVVADGAVSILTAVVGGDVDGATVTIGNSSDIAGDVRSGGAIVLGAKVHVGGVAQPHGHPRTFIPPDLPREYHSRTGGSDLVVDPGATIVLLPGSYGRITLGGSGSVLELQDGDYSFDGLEGLDSGSRIESGQTRLFVAGDVGLGAAFDGGVPLCQVLGSWTMPAGGSWKGAIFAPRGDVSFGPGTRLEGCIVAAGAVSLDEGFSLIRPTSLPDFAHDFRRGDADGDGAVDLSDAIAVLGYLFLGTGGGPCPAALDADDDGSVDLTDGVGILQYLFAGGSPPPLPGPYACGPDPTPDALPPCNYDPSSC